MVFVALAMKKTRQKEKNALPSSLKINIKHHVNSTHSLFKGEKVLTAENSNAF